MENKTNNDNKTVTDRIFELLHKNIILQGLIAFSLVNTLCLMYILDKPVPTDLLAAVTFVIGFYFGGKAKLNWMVFIYIMFIIFILYFN